MAGYTNWKDVLVAVRNDPPDTDNFYLVHINVGEEEKERSRFMTRREMIVYCLTRLGMATIGM